MARKVSAYQLEVLRKLSLSSMEQNAYRLGARLDSLEVLAQRGLVTKRATRGSIAFPHSAILWRITDAGLALLKSQADELAADWPTLPDNLEGIDRFSEYPVVGLNDSSTEDA